MIEQTPLRIAAKQRKFIYPYILFFIQYECRQIENSLIFPVQIFSLTY